LKKLKPIILPSTTTAKATASPIRKNIECDLGTSIWNSTLTAAASNSSNSTIVEKPHIPSPIARPTKSQTFVSTTTSTPSTIIPTTASSLTIDVNAVKEDFETFTIAAATSTVTTATTSACYDFAYDSTLKSASPIGVKSSPKLSKEVQKPASDGVELNSDHVQLKEKLEKIKDFWPGQADFEAIENGHKNSSLSQAHGPNVAKVKPQPQHHDSQQHQQQQQIPPFIAPENKQPKPIESFNAFSIPPSQSPNLYQRGGNAVFTMGQTSPFRQISSNQIYSIPTGYGSNDYIQQQQQQHYHNGHSTNSPTSFFGGGQIPQQQQPSRPQSYDGMFNSNHLWNSNGIDILSTITPPLQQAQTRYISNSRPPSHPSTNVTLQSNGFPPTHLPPPPPPHMGYQQQQPFQQQPQNYIPTHMPPPPLQHTYIELMSGPPPPPPIGATRSNGNGSSRPNLMNQTNQQNNDYRPPPQQMQILRPQQFNNNNNNFALNNGVQFPPPQQQRQQYHQHYQQNGVPRNNQQQQQQNRGQIQQQQWQKQDQQQPFHLQNQQQQNLNGHPSNNFGGYYNIKYTSSTTNQPTA
jgi:hypothetical protein